MAQQRSRTPPQKPFPNHFVSYGVIARRAYALRHSPKHAQLKGSRDSHGVHVANASLASRPVLWAEKTRRSSRSRPSRTETRARARRVLFSETQLGRRGRTLRSRGGDASRQAAGDIRNVFGSALIRECGGQAIAGPSPEVAESMSCSTADRGLGRTGCSIQ